MVGHGTLTTGFPVVDWVEEQPDQIRVCSGFSRGAVLMRLACLSCSIWRHPKKPRDSVYCQTDAPGADGEEGRQRCCAWAFPGGSTGVPDSWPTERWRKRGAEQKQRPTRWRHTYAVASPAGPVHSWRSRLQVRVCSVDADNCVR